MNVRSETYWADHYERLGGGEFALFRCEAIDYCERLARLVPLAPEADVLDFGCGFGFVAETMSRRVGHMHLWDASRNMLAHAVERTRDRPNVAVVDLSATAPVPVARFDAILVNSVVQYMSRDDLRGWLARWHSMLRPGGRVVLSDVVPLQSSFVAQLLQTLRFAWRHGFLLSAFGSCVAALGTYLRTRRAAELLTLSRDDVAALAGAAGFEVQTLPENLTYRRERLTAVLKRAAA